jgi:EAL domain-containing protein (putative c-di-GMP-specific phosphodiesterase class I)
MTTALIRRTARELAPLQDALPENFHVSINISANFLADPELIATCKQFYQQFRTGKIRLVLELTEREAIVPTEALQSQIRALRAEGILIALDDFGVGHSNLNYLKEFQADMLKIDRGFITGIGNNDLSCHVLQSIIDLSRQLKLKVIAEGIETLEQANYLQEKGVEYLQGYYFSKPQPIAVFKTQINKD